MNYPQSEIEFSSIHFLIIDDFEDMHTLLRQTLKNCGAITNFIDSASTAAEAVRLLEKKKYDVVLCDYNLGAGKTGQNILEEAKHRNLVGPACAWLVITAEKTKNLFMGTAEAQPDDYLLKPITAVALQLRLAKIWNKKKAFIKIAAAVASYDYPGAIKLCDQRLAFDQANAVDLLKLKAKLLLDSGNTDGARRTFEKVVAERNLPWAKVGLAKTMFQEGDLAGAKSLLKNVVAGNSYYLEAYDWLARVCQALGKYDEAEQALEKATAMSPNSVGRQKMLGDVSLKLGKLDNAEKAFKKSIGLGEHSILKTPDAYTGLAKTCSAKGDSGEALRILDTLNKDFDDDAARLKSLIAKGIVHQQSGDPIKAREVAKELSERIKDLPQRLESAANLEMAQLFLDIGEKEMANSLLQEEVKNNPENAEILERVKQVFVGAQMGEQGIALIESTRKSAIEQMNRGVLLAQEGKIEDAIIWMRNAREAMPTNARLLFNLAYVLITRLKKMGTDTKIVSEAREALIEANRLTPGGKRFTQLMESLKACECTSALEEIDILQGVESGGHTSSLDRPLVESHESQVTMTPPLDDANFAIHNRKEIVAILDNLVKTRSMINLDTSDGVSLLTSVLKVSAEGNYVYLDVSPDNRINDKIIHSKKVNFSTQTVVKVRWHSTYLHRVSLPDGDVFSMTFPAFVVRIQRREYFRLSTPRGSYAMTCKIPVKTDIIAATIVDMSAGGICVSIKGTLPESFSQGAQLQGCSIRFPMIGIVFIDLIFCGVQSSIKTKSGEEAHRIGMKFVNISRGASNVVQRYMTELEKDQINKAR